jgi:hypothetical protein
MDSRERYNDDETMLRAMLAGLQNAIWTALPGAIVSFDADSVNATVQPGVAGTVIGQDGKESVVSLPVLTDVPVVFPRGGGCTLTFPVAAGDECMIVFACRAIDAWAQSGGVQRPSEARRHDLSDAFVILGPMSQANKISGISTSTTQLRSDDGSTFVELDPSGQAVKVTAPGGINLNGVTIDASGNVSSPATITASDDITSTGGDVIATTVSLQNHLTTAVTSGGDLSGPPQ